ncbi:MAG: DUF4412 domain-containing protein [Proteobacteria bacterium]|nr:DUF4412 domain-containing protein [Pseudomonadota bacterium]
MQTRLALAIATLGCILAAPAWADFSADFADVQGTGRAALTRIEVGGGHMRMDTGSNSVLVDANSGRILMLMHDKKQYMDMGKMAQSLNAILANVPPQMRDMMKQRMAARSGGGTVTYASTGQAATVAGYACTMFQVKAGENHISDACLADLSAAGIDAADQATVRKVFDDLRAMAQTASAGMASSSINQLPTGKFPVRMTRYEDGKIADVSQIKGVSHAAVNRADFEIPAGYSEAEMPAMGMHH